MNIEIPNLLYHDFFVFPKGENFAVLVLDFIKKWHLAIVPFVGLIFLCPINSRETLTIQQENVFSTTT